MEKIRISKNERCFSYITGLIVSHISFGFTLAAYQGRDLSVMLSDGKCQYQGKPTASNKTIEFVVRSLVLALGSGTELEDFCLEVYDSSRPDAYMAAPWEVKRGTDFGVWQAMSTFVSFYDSVEDDIESRYGSDKATWPALYSFARVVRNSLAHGNKVSIRNHNATPVAWKYCTIGYPDNGKNILYDFLTFADLILLMKDVSDAI